MSRCSPNYTSAGSSSRTRASRGSCRRKRWEERRTCRTWCQPRKLSCASPRQRTPPARTIPGKGYHCTDLITCGFPPDIKHAPPRFSFRVPLMHQDDALVPRVHLHTRRGYRHARGTCNSQNIQSNAAPCSRTPFVHISVRARHDVSVVRNRGCPFPDYRVSDDRPRRRFPLVDVPFFDPIAGFEQGDAFAVAGELTGVRVDLLAEWTEPGSPPP